MIKTQQNVSGKSGKTILPLAFLVISLVSYAGENLPVPSALMVTKNLNNKKHKVRLFTASDYKTILFTVNGVEGKRYALFVFDLEGKLITQSAIRNRETGILPAIETGSYQYEVLADDMNVESGQLKVK